MWVQNPLLTTTGDPPFGANGIGFNKAQSIMFVANTGNDTIVQIPVTSGNPGTPAVFTNSINGADGLRARRRRQYLGGGQPGGRDRRGRPDRQGHRQARRLQRRRQDGVTRGLLFPASPAFSTDGKSLFVTNLELDLRAISLPQSVDLQWAAQVKRHSIAKLQARIPRISE